MPPRPKPVNWFDTWNRRSRLRSGKRMLAEMEETLGNQPHGFGSRRARPEKEIAGSSHVFNLDRVKKEVVCNVPPGFDGVKAKRRKSVNKKSTGVSKPSSEQNKESNSFGVNGNAGGCDNGEAELYVNYMCLLDTTTRDHNENSTGGKNGECDVDGNSGGGDNGVPELDADYVCSLDATTKGLNENSGGGGSNEAQADADYSRFLNETTRGGNGCSGDGGNVDGQEDGDYARFLNVTTRGCSVGPRVDDDYVFFLDHLRFDGSSYVFETVVDGSPLVLKYEEEENSSEVIQSEPELIRDNEKTLRKTCREEIRMQPCLSKKKPRNECSSPSSGETVETASPCNREKGEERFLADEDYLEFLNHVREHNGSMVLESKNNVVVKYEVVEGKENQACGTVGVQHEKHIRKLPVKEVTSQQGKQGEDSVERGKEIVVKCEPVDEDDNDDVVEELPIQTVIWTETDNICSSDLSLVPYTGDQGPSTSSAHENNCLWKSMVIKVDGPFRDRLEEVLQKPFDQDEFEKLWNLVSNRSSIIKYKHLRHDSVPYPTNELSRSFLDHYPDLKERIELADKVETLKLLRGFFFWLENLSHEGAFRPWTLAHTGCDVLDPELDFVIPLQVKRPDVSDACTSTPAQGSS